eukprot:12760712-Prorocentrum_lima.AAC.1
MQSITKGISRGSAPAERMLASILRITSAPREPGLGRSRLTFVALFSCKKDFKGAGPPKPFGFGHRKIFDASLAVKMPMMKTL